jgi:hypothetical protein
VSLRRADVCFALPRPVKRALVLGELPEWREALQAVGVDVDGEESRRRADLAVAPVALARQAVASGADMLVLEGRGARRRLVESGCAVARYLPLPSLESPNLLLPLEQPTAARYALLEWKWSGDALRAVRNQAAAGLIRMRVFPELPTLQTTGVRDEALPFVLSAAESLGVPQEAQWLQEPGQGDPLTRGVFHIFASGEREPHLVVKYARVRGCKEPFVRDEHGLKLAAGAGRTAAHHAPRFFGRFDVDGFNASVESAAVGRRLSTLLGGNRRIARETIEAVASWLVRLGKETAEPPAALEAERRRLAEETLPRWASTGAPQDLVARLPALPAVLQHNDLGTWNVVVGPRTFTVLDWESARRHGLPLWDLLYFLADAVPLLDGARDLQERTDGALAALRGDSPHSPLLFSWIRRAVKASATPAEAVGLLATLCWLHHGLSHRGRATTLERVASKVTIPPVERIAPVWLADPALGPGWDRWRS